MAEKSLFYNAFKSSKYPTGYDRNYNADDLSDWFSIVCDTGVLKGGLKVKPSTSGLKVIAESGKATINGKGYINESELELSLETAPTGTKNRYDLIVLRKDNTPVENARKTYLKVITGDDTIPTVSDLTRDSNIYDLLIAYVTVRPSATSISASDIIDCRGKPGLCPYFTAVKGYDDYYDAIIQEFQSDTTLDSTSVLVTTDIASSLYNDKYSLVDVYTNGLKESEGQYSVSTSGGFVTITFTTAKSAGSKINVVLSNFIDGEGMSTALSEYNTLVKDVATLKKANKNIYICNGKVDNLAITNLVNTFIDGGTDYDSMRLKIIGNFGFGGFAGGDGTSASPYKVFDFHSGNRKVILDFSDCSEITIDGQNFTVFFNAKNLKVEGLNLTMSGESAAKTIRVFNNVSGGNIECVDCRFSLNGYQDSLIAVNGTFTNCRGSVLNVVNNSYCFLPSAIGILRLYGGEYYAYTRSSSAKSAIVGQSQNEAVSILNGVNAPTVYRSGCYQTNAIYQLGGIVNSTDLITTLSVTVISGKSNVVGTIQANKPSQI